VSDYLGQMSDVVLGQDFLTWLWYKSDTQNGVFKGKDGAAFELHMEQRVSVQGGEGESLETAVVSGPMSELREARLGLANGKKVNKALVRLEQDSENWQVTLKAEDFTLSSLRTPTMEAGKEEGDDPDAKFLEKVYLVERCLDMLDSVYKSFVQLRLSPQWAQEVTGFRRWLERNA